MLGWIEAADTIEYALSENTGVLRHVPAQYVLDVDETATGLMSRTVGVVGDWNSPARWVFHRDGGWTLDSAKAWYAQHAKWHEFLLSLSYYAARERMFSSVVTKPQAVDDCVDALMADPDFEPREGRTKLESAWALCTWLYQEGYLKTAEQAVYTCECLDCGHIVETDQHCRDIVCPECGGPMRRLERPGVGAV